MFGLGLGLGLGSGFGFGFGFGLGFGLGLDSSTLDAAPLDQLRDLGPAELVDDGVDLVDDRVCAEALEVPELGWREGGWGEGGYGGGEGRVRGEARGVGGRGMERG